MTVRSFAEVTALVERAPGRFDGEVSAAWTIATKPNGGYLLAMLGRAAIAVGPHAHVMAASAHYLRAPDPGPVAVEAEVLRTGRSAAQVAARLSQDGARCVEALITLTNFDAEALPFWSEGVPRRGTVPRDECERLIPQSPSGMRVPLMEQVDVRLEPESLSWARGAARGIGELHGWLALPDDEPFDTVSLLFAADALPPATFDIELSGWVPTLEMTVYVRALPQPGPVQVLQRAQLIDGRRVDEACYVWDSRGRLVAHATQLAGIRLG